MASVTFGLVHKTLTATDIPSLREEGIFVRPAPPTPAPTHHPAVHAPQFFSSSTRSSTSPSAPPAPSKLETLPVEILHQILTHLIHPRAHLPGLTESQSAHDFPAQTKTDIKIAEDLTLPPDNHHWAADLFSLRLLSHPLHALSLTSRRCHGVVEAHCAHLVRACNGTMFNLPFAHLDRYGAQCVYPDMSGIVYRRLWLQHAPRRCVYCFAVIDCYPFALLKRVMTACQDCFYRQTLVRYYSCPLTFPFHFLSSLLSSPRTRTNPAGDYRVVTWLQDTRYLTNTTNRRSTKSNNNSTSPPPPSSPRPKSATAPTGCCAATWRH